MSLLDPIFGSHFSSNKTSSRIKSSLLVCIAVLGLSKCSTDNHRWISPRKYSETRRTAVPIKVWVRIDLLMGQRPYLCLLVWRKAAAKQQAEQGPALGCQEWEERVRLANGRFHCQSAPGQR